LSLRSWLPLLCVTLLVILCAIRLYRKTEILPLLVIAYLVLVLPSSGLLMFGNYSPGNRYMYLPSALLIAFLSLAFCKMISAKIYYLIPVFALVGVLTLLSRMQVPNWKDDLSLWQYVTKQQPKSAAALTYLGVQLEMHRQITLRESADIVENAVSIEPIYVGLSNLLTLYTALNDQENLLRTHERLVRYYPKTSPASMATLGLYELTQGRFDRAKKFILDGSRIDATMCAQIQKQVSEPARNMPAQFYLDLDNIIMQAKSEKLCP
jgi:hypothetical protein